MKKIKEPKTTLKEDLIFTTVAAIVIPIIFAIIVLIVKGVIWLNSLNVLPLADVRYLNTALVNVVISPAYWQAVVGRSLLRYGI